MTPEKLYDEYKDYPNRLAKVVEEAKKQAERTLYSEGDSEKDKLGEFLVHVVYPFNGVSAYIMQHSPDLISTVVGESTLECTYTTVELYDTLQELRFPDLQEKILSYAVVKKPMVMDKLLACILHKDKEGFCTLLSTEECDTTRLCRVLSFVQLSQMQSSIHFDDDEFYTAPEPYIKKKMDSILWTSDMMSRCFDLDRNEMPETHYATKLFTDLEEILSRVIALTDDTNGEVENCDALLEKAEQDFIDCLYPVLVHQFADAYAILEAPEKEVLRKILRAPGYEARFDHSWAEQQNNSQITEFCLPENLFEGRVGERKGGIVDINYASIYQDGVEKFTNFVNVLAKNHYIKDDNDTKLAFARDFLKANIQSPVEKVEWTGDVNAFYFMVRELSSRGSANYTAAEKVFRVPQGNSSTGKSRKASRAKDDFRHLLADFYVEYKPLKAETS